MQRLIIFTWKMISIASIINRLLSLMVISNYREDVVKNVISSMRRCVYKRYLWILYDVSMTNRSEDFLRSTNENIIFFYCNHYTCRFRNYNVKCHWCVKVIILSIHWNGVNWLQPYSNYVYRFNTFFSETKWCGQFSTFQSKYFIQWCSY